MLNRNKTEGMWIGCITHCKDKIENINWVTYYVKYLGIYYMMVLNVDTHSFSILVTDATYVILGIINDLANIILSTIVMFLFFQEFIIFSDIKSCFFILSE
jgi:hypothetical protein